MDLLKMPWKTRVEKQGYSSIICNETLLIPDLPDRLSEYIVNIHNATNPSYRAVAVVAIDRTQFNAYLKEHSITYVNGLGYKNGVCYKLTSRLEDCVSWGFSEMVFLPGGNIEVADYLTSVMRLD